MEPQQTLVAMVTTGTASRRTKDDDFYSKNKQ